MSEKCNEGSRIIMFYLFFSSNEVIYPNFFEFNLILNKGTGTPGSA